VSTEQSPTPGGEPPSADVRPGRQRRRQLSVVTVAAAVLLAGGGGAYWASTAGDGAGPQSGGASEPPALALDGLSTQAGGDGEDGSGKGIAPGEPNPNRQIYKPNGKLPEGPRTAAVYRTPGSVTSSTVNALAESLGVGGEPEKKSGRWVVEQSGKSGGDSLTLSVNDERMAGNWTFQTEGSPVMPCGKPLPTVPGGGPAPGSQVERPESCPSVPGSGKGDPVSEKEAEDAVQPVLKTLKLTDAELDASVTTGSLRMVSVTPDVGGMTAQDRKSTFSVDEDGKIVRGHGSIGKLRKGSSYPVMSASETLEQLNKHGAGGGSTVREPAPPAEEGQPGETKAGPGGEKAAAGKPLKVTDAKFGLVTRYSVGKPVLVPSWLFEVRLPGGGQTASVAHPAVEPEYLKPAKPQQPGGGTDTDDGTGSGQPGAGDKPEADTPLPGVKSYEAEGRTLKLTFWGGVCDKYQAQAEETGKSVEVTIRAEESGNGRVCVKMAKQQTVEVELDEKLGDRKVVDAQDGERVPRAD
jgi:hypothetical protein